MKEKGIKEIFMGRIVGLSEWLSEHSLWSNRISVFFTFLWHTHKHSCEYYIDIFISVEINEGNKNKMNPAEQIKKNKSPTPMN